MTDSERISTALERVAVAVPGPFAGPLHYLVPAALRAALQVGHAVLVPLGKRQVTGWVTALDPPVDSSIRLRDVTRLLDEEPVLRPIDLEFARQLSSYYMHPLGEVLRTALPGAERSETHSSYVLTEQGRTHRLELEASLLLGETPELGLLNLLAAKGRRRNALLAALRKRGVQRGGRLLSAAMRAGFVEEAQVTDRKRRSRPTETWLTLTKPLAEAMQAFARRGAVRDRLIMHLDRRGAVPLTELLDQFPTARRIIKQLNDRALLHMEQRVIDGGFGDQGASDGEIATRPQPNDAQQSAVDRARPALDEGRFEVFALEGVTGSGKTEVYLRLAERALELGGGVLVLVPEIALTPQLEQRFRARLGSDLVLLHSGRTAAERHDAFRALRDGQARTALGVRSAVFAPVANLRLIIVDEEHDDSYKQEDGLRYNARDAAVLRGRLEQAAVVLGSATLSMETWLNVEQGRYRHLLLPERVAGRPMPKVEIVKLEGVSTSDAEAGRWLTDRLLDELGQTLDAGEQALLLLNRRGFATYVLCGECGTPFVCPDCDASLVFHARSDRLRCHLCGWWRERPESCANCLSEQVVLAGRGTERIEDEVSARFPGARVDRMDRDTTRRRGSHAEILERFRRREVDLLIGTQMLAKGHDLPGVTLVGVLHADAGLGLPDFRAPERTFQLLTQVAGRAGRGEQPGRVIFQAMRPEHPILKAAAAQDAPAFRSYEVNRRRMARWPPHTRMALLRFDATDPDILRDFAAETARDLRRATPASGRLLGPVPPLAPRLGGRHRLQILLRCDERRDLRRWLLATGAWQPGARSAVRVGLDIDPLRVT